MKNIFFRGGLAVGALLVGAALVFPLVVLAHDINIWSVPPGYWGQAPDQVLTCRGTQCNFCELLHTFQHLAYLMISIGVFAIAPILFVWGGIRIITAGASPEGVSAGKRILVGTVVGMLIALGAFLIVNTVVDVLNSVNSGAGSMIWNNGQITCTPGKIPGLK